jgi:hypothetical protein
MKHISIKKISLWALICVVLCCLSASVCLAVSAPAQVENLKAKPAVASVSLSWTKIKSCDGYSIFYYSPTTEKYTFIKNVTDNECKITGLAEGETYYFAVQSYNNDESNKLYGNISESVKTTTKIESPKKVKELTSSDITTNKVKLSWDSIPDVKYAVYFYNADTQKYTLIANTSSESYTVKDLEAETTYRFSVRAFKKVGGKNYYGDYSAKLKVTTQAPALKIKEARKLFDAAIDVYMKWVYSCAYTSTDYITRNFYGTPCRFALVNHPDIKSKADIEKLLSKYFAKELYENELYFYIEVGDKLYYYAEGGAGDPDKGTKHYTEALKKVNHKKYKYTLTPTYYPKYENENNPKSFVFTITRKDGRWIFDDKFYTCCAKIKD